MSEAFSHRQLTFRLWALVLLGLVASGAIAVYVSWSLSALNAEARASRTSYQAAQLQLERLRRLSNESHSQTLALLIGQGDVTPGYNLALEQLHRELTGADDQLIDPAWLAELNDRVNAMGQAWQRAQSWSRMYLPLLQDLDQERSLGAVRTAILALQASIDSLEGQHNLHVAQQLRRWKIAENGTFSSLAQQILQQKTLLWPRALRAASTEITELARLVELLAAQKSESDLADIKDNQLKPVLDRLNRQMAVLRRHKGRIESAALLDSSVISRALFGSGYRYDPAHQTIVVGSHGLFWLQQRLLELEQARQRMVEEAELQREAGNLNLDSIQIQLNQQRQVDNLQAEEQLARALVRMALSVAVLAVLFLLLGLMISRHIRRQFVHLEALQEEKGLILNSAGEGVIGLAASGEIRFINPTASKMLGVHDDQVVGLPLQQFWKTGGGEPATVWPTGSEDRVIDQHCRLVLPGGHDFMVEYSAMPMLRDGHYAGAVITLRDISESERIKAALLESEQKFRDLSEKSLVGVYIIQDGLFIYVNPQFAEVFGYGREEIESHLGPQHLAHPDDLNRVARNIKKRVSGAVENLDYSIRGIRKDGSEIHVDLLGSATQYQGHAAIIGTLVDTTARTLAEAQIQHQAYHDSLTGLPNRLLCSDRLNHALKTAERMEQRVAVLFLDLDRFKHINDSLGHAAGDNLLIIVAERLSQASREVDTVARLGGDEFMIILEAVEDRDAVAGVARKIKDAFAEPVELSGHELFVTTSIGISLYPEDGSDAETLTKNADAAMYQAKHKGRSTHAFYTTDLTLHSSEWLELESTLRWALPRNELYLEYQPLIDMNDGRLIGAEALLRWQHPEKGLISPAKFIPLAEETGLILEIGDWVLDQACQQIGQWRQQGYRVPRIAVNVSSIQISRGDVLNSVERLLERHDIPSSLLELEITENCIMEHSVKSGEVLQSLRDRGISLAIDDFGTGYSSLGYLKRLPINKLKIDQSLLADIPRDRSDEAIAKAVIMLGQLLDLEVVAEGIETEEQRRFVHDNGCHIAQGYLFSRPVSAEMLAEMLTVETVVVS